MAQIKVRLGSASCACSMHACRHQDGRADTVVPPSLRTQFPKELSVKIDPKKVNWAVMKEWIAARVTELLGGLEEEVLIGLIYNYLEMDKVRWECCC